MTADELIALNEQIAGMARAGLPLDQGLSSLAREMSRGRLRRVTAALAADLTAGTPLPEAVERRQRELPPFYAHLLQAGIRTGRLPEVLATMTTYARSVAATRAVVADALFYPMVVIVFAAALLGGFVFGILPQFEKIFADFNMRLPLATEMVLALGRQPVTYVVWPLASLLVVLLAIWAILRSSGRGRVVRARLLYALPGAGALIRAARLAAFADLLAVLVEYELPLPEAFRLAGAASTDPLMAGEALRVYHALSRGSGLGESLRGRGLLPEWVVWMAGAGERRGALAETLRQIGALYRRQVDSRAALLRSVMPAFMIIATAAVLVAAFTLTIILPMVRLLEALSR